SEHWPQLGRPHPMLPVALQREAGIPHSSSEIDVAFCDRVMRRLLSSANEVVLSFASSDGDRELSPSPVLRGMRLSDTSELPNPAPTWYDALHPAIEVFAEAVWSPFTAESAPGGARLFDLQAACPFRAFAELRLNAHALDAPLEGIAPVTRGKL